ncbi:Cof-type HAD-IIB family hydrolase [Paracidobacterium acidisoli]|uniref:HAD family phosphatase n=1 Tax=Paracidobacterium acidisoli TaxID=2303751 RepID=A0A372IPJ9_9BACT|nr:Cof-type HAD-IIB family hydrolase [Paracidobacterium acidisoli]MBT9331209.1 Cof-type HAD-IIB family hydrolase [Paracidobacterium acidisoli]
MLSPFRLPAPRLIAIDIDGTLLPSRGTAVSERNRQALREAEAAGIEIVIATGRRHTYTTPIIEPIGLRSQTVLITSNGTVTRALDGMRIDRRLLPVETARGICPLLREFGETTVFTFDRDGAGELVIESFEQLHARISLWVEANRASLIEVRPIERVFDSGEAPVQSMICGTPQEMRDAEQRLTESAFAEQIELHRTEYPHRDLTILDILPPGCSKGVSLHDLATARGIAREEIMAIGDNWNDLEMLEYAGRPVVMANGAPDLVELAQNRGWTLAPSNDADGVAQMIESVCAGVSV